MKKMFSISLLLICLGGCSYRSGQGFSLRHPNHVLQNMNSTERHFWMEDLISDQNYERYRR